MLSTPSSFDEDKLSMCDLPFAPCDVVLLSKSHKCSERSTAVNCDVLVRSLLLEDDLVVKNRNTPSVDLSI